MSGSWKKLLPVRLKRPLWYLLKSPQRRLGFRRSWGIELSALMHWLAHTKRPLQPLAICVGIKDRTDNFLQFVLPSLLGLEDLAQVELSIYDCGSADKDYFEKEIRTQWAGPLTFVSENRPFARAYAFNRAIHQSTAPLIFACDADMALPPDLVRQVNRYVSARTVWFPICFHLYQDRPAEISPANGQWWPVGKGMFAARRSQFEIVGGFNEKYTEWGYEDWDIWFRFWQKGFLPLRTRCRGLFHHYHPSLKPEGFQPKF